MIPVRLQLKNFMSYGTGVPPLELAGIRLACISGDNGNGKTALLDAITWALFDECRAKSKDDVIRLGASDCGVILDFLIDAQIYRIKRQISKKSAGSLWELQIKREDGSYHPLSGTNQKETQAKIKSLLRMDYDTFLATAYLAQGRADEFARATPNKRKEVLADILDLSRYDKLEEMAKEEVKEATVRETDIQRTLNGIDAQLANRDRYEMALEDAERRLTSISQEIAQLHQERERLSLDLNQLDVKEQRVRNLEEKIADAEARNTEDHITLNDLLPRIARAEAIQSRKQEIETNFDRFNRLQNDMAVWDAAYRRAIELGRECTMLENTINAEQTRLDRERYQRDCQIDEYSRDVESLTQMTTYISDLEARQQTFGDVDTLLAENAEQRQNMDNQLADLKGEHGVLKHSDALLLKRLEALQSSDLPNCEYCGQPLPASQRQQNIAQAEAERETIRQQLGAVSAKANRIKRETEQLRAAELTLRQTQREKTECEAQIRSALQQQMRLEERVKLLPQIIKERDALADQLARKDYAQKEQAELAAASREREKAEAAYAPMEAARAELNLLKNAARERDHLHDAEALLQTEPPRVTDLQAKITKRLGQIAAAQKMVVDSRGELSELPAMRRAVAENEAQITQVTTVLERTNREIGQLQGEIENCRKSAEERIRYAEELTETVRRKDLYRELTGAFGKKGVQALIIENTLPEIMQNANELLGKLSQGGAMSVELRTTREAKSKTASGNIETLDIVISDDMGTRPYEMFSGGEAFRVNFALRVALSRMLANRAGAPLQTLIVDEGFGTQDPRGREAITDALQAIQDYFALILCITHIEDIKETFPNRIEVVKGPNGSTFTVV